MTLRKKTIFAHNTAERLVGSKWGAAAKTLRTADLSLVYSTAEYCGPVWYRSVHTRLIDSVLNDALRIVTGCLRPTLTDHLSKLSDIQPDEHCRLKATLSLADIWTLIMSCMVIMSCISGSSDAHQERLRSIDARSELCGIF